LLKAADASTAMPHGNFRSRRSNLLTILNAAMKSQVKTDKPSDFYTVYGKQDLVSSRQKTILPRHYSPYLCRDHLGRICLKNIQTWYQGTIDSWENASYPLL
jgi:hypothetical protein